MRIAIFSLLLLCLSGNQAWAQWGRSYPKAEPLQHLSFAEKKFNSKALGRKSPYGIYLPKDYDSETAKDRDYPLIVYLHGLNEDHRRFSQRPGQAVLDKMAGDKSLPELIFVCVEGGRSFYMNSERGGAVEDMLMQDLLPHLESKYRIRSGRENRALLGVSMGGLGALSLAFKHPKLFGSVASHSAAILPKDPSSLQGRRGGWAKRMVGGLFGEPMDQEKWQRENPLFQVASLKEEDRPSLNIYFDCGSKDRYGFQGTNTALHEAMTKLKIPHQWRLVDGGGHGWRSGYNQGALPHSLTFLANQLQPKLETVTEKPTSRPQGDV